jgi:hypothetical protein
MNNLNTLFFGFLGVMVVGFLIVAFSGKSEHQKMGEAMIMSANMLNVHARDKCAEEAERRIKTELYTPSESASDGITYVQMVWKGNDPNYKEVSCRYERDKGVMELVVDGKKVIP